MLGASGTRSVGVLGYNICTPDDLSRSNHVLTCRRLLVRSPRGRWLCCTVPTLVLVVCAVLGGADRRTQTRTPLDPRFADSATVSQAVREEPQRRGAM
ncbi:hypothetical protein L227DRAFT_268549 [Lentinus tigrinus ALCF2SS1-6]|uniref:Uncharacterized protein n=1 Tax=Lentinus tigrinus ALCF2SS1-6 TaxID=1328759 RepID=A0A5C2SNR0_9APHY|nr:hypothetical protein L227DRAFT_268549 [Lentinus tigrinus ALCF2SS1-6]